MKTANGSARKMGIMGIPQGIDVLAENRSFIVNRKARRMTRNIAILIV